MFERACLVFSQAACIEEYELTNRWGYKYKRFRTTRPDGSPLRHTSTRAKGN